MSNLTKQEIFKEYAKCLETPIYAIETFLITFDKTQEGFVPFKLFPKQKEIIYAYERNRFNLVTKPRQAGVSTTTAAYFSIKVAFADIENPEAILIIANKQELAFEFLAKIKDFLSQIPRWVWGPEYYGNAKNEAKTIFIRDAKGEIKLPNGSRVKAVATSKDALRGFTPTYLVMDEAAYIDNGDTVFGAALTALGTGGKATLISCVTKDTFVYTNNGIKQVTNFIDEGKEVNKPYIVNSLCLMGKDRARNTNIMVNNGKQKTIKLRTRSSHLECSETHLIWGYSNKLKRFGWLNAKYLEIGDYINIQSGFDLWGNNDEINHEYSFSNKRNKPKIIYNKITKDLSYLIGMYIAKGCTYKKYNKSKKLINADITFSCCDDLSEIINKCGFKFSCHKGLHYTISSKYLASLLESLGLSLDDKPKDKKIPNRLLEISRENIIALVQGIMDGNSYYNANNVEIGIKSLSFELIKQLQIILNNFGIRTYYQTGITPIIKISNVETEYHRISITSIDAIKYYDIIGFRSDRKQNKKQKLNENFKTTQNDFIPNGKVIIRNIIDDLNLTRKFSNTGILLNTLKVYKENKTSDLNRKTFEKFYNYLTLVLKLDLSKYNIDKILINNGTWEKINNLQYSENNVYDFSLPNIVDDEWSHSIIYNGILGHQTPNGMDPLYYRTYDLAKQKKNSFNIIEMKWYEDLRYNKDLRWFKGDITEVETEFTFESYKKRIDEGWKPTSSWYEEMCQGMNNDAKMIAQELDVSFIGSGGNIIDEKYIQEQEKNNVKEPIFTAGADNEIWIWEKPIEGHQYILASDVSRGDGEDSSTMVILDFTTMEEVVEYQGKIQPDLLAQIIEEYGNLYKAYTVVDITGGMGVSTVLKLLEFDYKRLHYDMVGGKVLSIRQRELSRFDGGDKIPGFQATSVRLPMVSNLEYKIRTNEVKIRSTRMISEMNTFVFKNGRPDHMTGYHDDLLMALAMCLWVIEHSFKNLERLEKQTKAMLNSWVASSPIESIQQTELERGTGFVSKAQRNKKAAPKPKFNHIVSKNMQDPTGRFMWLFSGTK